MNIVYSTIIESLLFLCIAFYLGSFIKSNTNNSTVLYSNYLFWIMLIILSILINFKKYLYFISFYLITVLITIGLIYKLNIKKYFKKKTNLYFLVILLIISSIIVLFNFIISKYFIYDMINTKPPQGDKGEVGKYGESGTPLFIETIAEKCFQDVYNHLEESYEKIKKSNDIEFNSKDYHINNKYIKDNIKRICYSKEFLDNFYLSKLSNANNSNITPECIMKYDSKNNMVGRFCNLPNKYGNIDNCNVDSDCYIIEDSNLTYNIILNKIKHQIAGGKHSMLELILRNNCKEDIKLRDSFGGSKNLTLDDMYNNPNESYDTNLKYNNKMGHKFLNDHFMNDKYWETNLNKNINNNPFDKIKELEVWKWGIPKKKCTK
jgi:hypothetical protein